MEGGGGGGETRRIHIVYFLSRLGRIEQPHLLRVHHLNRNGVYLRDVKKWLAELRGKDMAESFAWSYKRRYKMGYVWQDLLDEDLITPISDNEYVLKGSEISSNPFPETETETERDSCVNSNAEKKASMQQQHQQQQPVEVEQQYEQTSRQSFYEEAPIQGHPKFQKHVRTRTLSSEINEESPLFGSQGSERDSCVNSNAEKKASMQQQHQQQQPVEVEQQYEQTSRQSFYEEAPIQGHPKFQKHVRTRTLSSEINEESPLFGSQGSTLTEESIKLEEEKPAEKSTTSGNENLDKQIESLASKYNKKKHNNNNNKTKKASSSHSSPFTRSRSHSSGGASHIFRNLIRCGAVDTKDSVMVMINPFDKPASPKPTKNSDDNAEVIFKGGDKMPGLGGSARVFSTSGNHHPPQSPQYKARKSWDGVNDSKKKNVGNQKTVFSAAYKPVTNPNCSQCGKSFKPEKLHTHMKSCRGMKALAKSAAAAASAAQQTPSRRSSATSSKEPVDSYFLTH